MVVINLNQLLMVLACGLVGCLIALVIRAISILGVLKQVMLENKAILHNTLSNVDEISTSTKDVYGAITGKVTKFVTRKDKKPEDVIKTVEDIMNE